MALGAICEAAVTLSDNTAANLMFAAVGGPAGVTAFLRAAGDPVTRLDYTEPMLNEGRPGDPRDTTTPFAMAATLRALTLGSVLQPASRTQLAAWLVANRTGATRLRAGLPPDWRVGEKTGTGDGTANNVGILWPPGRAPLVVIVFVIASTAPPTAQEAALAAVARLAAAGARNPDYVCIGSTRSVARLVSRCLLLASYPFKPDRPLTANSMQQCRWRAYHAEPSNDPSGQAVYYFPSAPSSKTELARNWIKKPVLRLADRVKADSLCSVVNVVSSTRGEVCPPTEALPRTRSGSWL